MADTNDNDRIARPIWLKLAIFAATIAVLASVVSGFALMRVAGSTVRATSRDYRLAIAEDVAETIDTSMQTAQVDVATAVGILSDPTLPPDTRLTWLLSFVESSRALDHLDIYGPDGKHIDRVVATDGVPERDAVLPAELLDALRRQPGVVTGRVHFAGGSRVELFGAIRPVNSEITGFVATRVPLDELAGRIRFIEEHRLPSAASRLLVVDRDLRVVAADGVEVGSALGPSPLLESPDVVLQKQVAQSGEVGEGDAAMVTSVLPYPDLGWFVVVEVAQSEAYAAVHTMQRSLAIALLVVVLGALGAALLGARRIARPMRELAEFARRIARREFDERVHIETRDEVGMLAGVLNTAAADLKAGEQRIREEVAIRADLGRYLPAELVDAVVRREQDLDLGGSRLPITVLFVDIVRFTQLCERLSPEDVVSLLNEYFSILTEIVFRHGGTMDKFIGDGAMAFWGAPTPCEDHADRALRAAEDILRWLEVGNAGWKERFDVQLEVAIGVNTGEPIVGNIGSQTRMEYTVIGAAVNNAARLEALARPGQILTTNTTREASAEYEFARITEEVLHVGTDEVELWEVLV